MGEIEKDNLVKGKHVQIVKIQNFLSAYVFYN